MKKSKIKHIHLFFVWLYIFTLFNDMFSFGVVSIPELITLFYLTSLIKELFSNKKLYNLLRYFIIEWKYLLLLTFVFGILILSSASGGILGATAGSVAGAAVGALSGSASFGIGIGASIGSAFGAGAVRVSCYYTKSVCETPEELALHGEATELT